MPLNQKKKTIAINTGLLAYTFTKLGDNLTNNDGDDTNCEVKLDLKYMALLASMPSGLNEVSAMRSDDVS